jgi:hypothetical protein
MKWLFPCVALVIGLLAGWFIAGPSDSSADSSVDSEDTGARTKLNARAPGLLTGPNGEAVEPPELTQAETAALEAVGISDEWMAELEDMDQLDQLSALLERLKGAQSADFISLMDAVQKYSGAMRWSAQGILATKWATTDPQGMLVYIDTQPANLQWGLRNSLFSAWVKEDFNAAYASATKLSDQNAQRSALQAVVKAVAVDDPQRAIEIAKEMQTFGHRSDWVMRSIYQVWAGKDLVTARNSAMALPDGPDKVQALSGAMSNWMQEAPLMALDWLESLPASGSVHNSKREVFRQLLNRDFDVAKSYIEGKVDPVERREILQHVSFGNLAWRKSFEEIEQMYSWVGEVATGQVYDQKVGDIMRSLVQVDRGRAEAFVLDLPAGNARMNAIGSLAQQIAQGDPIGAIEFASGLAYEDEKQRALSHMSYQIARYGVEEVAPFVAASEDSMVQQQLASRIVGEWSKYDQPGALAWAESLKDDGARSSALHSIYGNWIQADPGAAFAYLETSVEEGKQANYLRNGFQDWARQDPGAAVQWLDRMPDSIDEKGSSDIYNSVARPFVQHDPMAASEWIAGLEDGPNRDRSVETLVQSISKTDPEAGFIWAATVTGDDMRKSNLNRSVREWVKTDPDAAFQAVKESKIEASEKEPLFEMIKKAQGK